MQYMSFDLSYFSTVPGMIITGGVILVILGMIVFIISGKKKNVDVTQDASATDKPNDEVTNATQATPEDVNASQPENVVATPEVVDTPVEASVEVKTEENVAPAEVTTTEVETPVQAAPVEATPEVATPAVSVEVPTVEEKKEEPAPSADSTVSIYGGVSPQVTVTTEEEPRKVYGGADPLENTGALPRVETPVVEATPAVQTTEEVAPAKTAEPAVPAVEEKPASAATPNTDVETLEF